MAAYIFDADRWIREFPLESLQGQIMGSLIGCAGPAGMAADEQIRVAVRASGFCGTSVPVDAFVWAKGEPPDRHVTKFGGLPYRAAGVDWPWQYGEPTTFLAQVYFGDSRDIVGETPGDVLLVFVPPDVDAGATFVFEWQNLGLSNLVAQDHLPKPGFEFATCYGVRHRTLDYSEMIPDDAVRTVVSPKWAGAESEGRFDEFALQLSRLPHTKIGGLAPFPWPSWREELKSKGTLLATLTSTVTMPGIRYPWLNVEQPLSMSEAMLNARNSVMIMNGFVFALFLLPDGEVEWRGWLYG